MKSKLIKGILCALVVISFVGCKDKNSEVKDVKDDIKVEDNKEEEKQESETETESDLDKNEEVNTEEENTTQVTQVEYLKYGNGRFGFEIEYPSFLVMQPAPDNNDGRIFKSEDGKVTLVASGINNAMFMTLQDAFDFSTKNLSNITYQNISERSYVVSWEEEGTIFYKCEVVGEGSTNQFTISYPKDEAEFYSDIVNRCYNSFIPGDLDSYH